MAEKKAKKETKKVAKEIISYSITKPNGNIIIKSASSVPKGRLEIFKNLGYKVEEVAE